MVIQPISHRNDQLLRLLIDQACGICYSRILNLFFLIPKVCALLHITKSLIRNSWSCEVSRYQSLNLPATWFCLISWTHLVFSKCNLVAALIDSTSSFLIEIVKLHFCQFTWIFSLQVLDTRDLDIKNVSSSGGNHEYALGEWHEAFGSALTIKLFSDLNRSELRLVVTYKTIQKIKYYLHFQSFHSYFTVVKNTVQHSILGKNFLGIFKFFFAVVSAVQPRLWYFWLM